MAGTDWQSYPALSQAAAADTLLILDTSDTSAATAGTVKQVTVPALVPALPAAQIAQRAFCN